MDDEVRAVPALLPVGGMRAVGESPVQDGHRSCASVTLTLNSGQFALPAEGASG